MMHCVLYDEAGVWLDHICNLPKNYLTKLISFEDKSAFFATLTLTGIFY